MKASPTSPTLADRASAEPQLFAGRYQLHELLGRGGTASVHRATDVASGRTLALKQLLQVATEEQHASAQRLLEREYHTLAQLDHPCVITVYDFGVTEDGVSFYTMELLDGGDLRERAPVPWQEACRLLRDVCSSLALLHSRRLLHRDISPRNIRCTGDGAAKLIDFGTMSPMSDGGSPITGTPGFTAPETVHRSALDARTDLYSLGATFYYALTGKLAYPARTFAELLVVWQDAPAPPSTHVPGIPAALDDLVLSLISLEPQLRPPSAFDVMQRLAAIAELPSQEAASVSRAYLATPALVGRAVLLADVRELLRRGLSIGGKGILVRAEPGLGRSRFLDACALEAKTLGARVLRATANAASQDFAVAFALAQHLVEALPDPKLAEQFPQLFEAPENGRSRLRDLAALCVDPARLQADLERLLRASSKLQPIVLAVDDVHRVDEPSAAVIAALMDRTRHGRTFVVLTADSEASGSARALEALSRRCELRVLSPLTQSETHTLFGSVFGDVPNLDGLTREIYGIAQGNPQRSLEVAQYLLDRGKVCYEAGAWTLPRSLAHEDLPESAEAAIRTRVEQLRPLARQLAEAHALSFDENLSPEAYRELASEADAQAVDAALTELVSQRALVGDGRSYRIANRVWRNALEVGLDEGARAARHRALASYYRPRARVAWLHHAFLSGGAEDAAALDGLLELVASYPGSDPARVVQDRLSRLGAACSRVLEIAQRLGRPRRQRFELLGFFTAISSVGADVELYRRAARPWLEQLVHDTGLDLWRLDDQNADAGARLGQALTKAMERYAALPEHERVYRVDEAIPQLAGFVAISIAIGARTNDLALLVTLPPLLQPFAALSPLLDALWQNALGTAEGFELCHYERARERWIEILAKLQQLRGSEIPHLDDIRNAIAYGIGALEAFFGIASAVDRVADLERDPYQQVSALYIRKVVRLEQGDWAGAEKFRREAEVIALRAHIPPMFTTLAVEISAHAYARDLAGVKDVIDRERIEAARYPGWVPYLREAEARFELARGDYAAAKARYDRMSEWSTIDEHGRSDTMPVWVAAQGGMCEALLGLGRAAEARATARAALAICAKNDIRMYSYELERMLALAEAKLGDFDSANARLDRIIAAQTVLGTTGLRIGINYEARAEIALWQADPMTFDQFAKLTAREYRYGAGSPLGVRYERLMHEARRRGITRSTKLSDFRPTISVDSDTVEPLDPQSAVGVALAGARSQQDLCLRALRLVCSMRSARGGHLYLKANEGPQLVASFDLPAPGSRLSQCVAVYLNEQEDTFATQTMALDDDAAHTAGASMSARIDETEYELFPLSCMQDGEPLIVGVVVLVPGDRQLINPYQVQLMATIAARLHEGAPRRDSQIGEA